MRTVTCACGAVLSYRAVYHHYRLVDGYAVVRERSGLGRSRGSRTAAFMDAAEAATRGGASVVAMPQEWRTDGRVLAILKKCKSVGYLEYACPQCGATLTEDKQGRGFVRHTTNRKCRFEKGQKDE